MRIQHNITAMNSYRNYTANAGKLSKNLEKLSSGYKINRAGDDAAGLAISEKMRSQITGLNAAQKNVKDGISLVKTAEGALQEVQDMLNRMVYLAEQSENGTYDDSIDRNALNDEVKALNDEINRIATTANFNGQKLLQGSLASVKFKIGDSAMTADTLNMGSVLSGAKLSANGVSGLIKTASAEVTTATKASALLKTLRGNGLGDSTGVINKVSQLRGRLGATQNRLEHTLKNLGVMTENITDAESNVRDTDVAEEMMAYTKNNILMQSAQAMLAQANQVPQGVLQLLQ